MNGCFSPKSALVIALSLSAGLAISNVASAQSQTPTFTDVPADYWANDYIEALAEQGAIAGFPDGSFRPNAPVTRAQFAAILRQTFTATAETAAQSFADVPADYWANDAITAARSARFLSGYPGNVFQPEQYIPRVQTLVSLVSGLDYTNSSRSSDADDNTYYTDSSDIPTYAQDSIAAATQRRLVVNHPMLRQLDPNRSATRAEVVASIYQALVRENRSRPLARAPYLVTTASSSWRSEPVATFPIKATDISLSRDGRRLVALLGKETSDASSRVEVWDTQTGELVTSMTANEDTRFEAVAISEDGLKVAAITQTRFDRELNLLVWDLVLNVPPTSELLGGFTLPPFTPISGMERLSFVNRSSQVAFGANGTRILTQIQVEEDTPVVPGRTLLQIHQVGAEGTTSRALQTRDLETSRTRFDQFDFSPDGTLLVGNGQVTLISPLVGEEDFSGPVIDIWELDSGELVDVIRPEAASSSIAFTPTGALRTLVRGMFDADSHMWDLQTMTRIDQAYNVPGVDRQDYTHILSPDGIHFFVRGDVAGTRVINMHTSEITRLNSRGGQTVFSKSGDHLAISTSETINIFSQENSSL